MIEKRRIGHTDHAVSVIGLGTVKFGRDQQVKYPQPFTIPSDQEVIKLLSMAQNAGINVIDTAPAYGNSEERLGELLLGSRKDWHIITKVGESFIDGQSSFNFTPEHIIKSIENSLHRLKTDYIDTVLIHSDGNDSALINQGTLEVLEHLKKKGYLCLSGMSTKTVAGGMLALQHSDLVMLPYNLDDSTHAPVIEEAQRLQKGIFIKKILASGHHHEAKQRESVFEQALSFPAVSSIIVGTINPAHLQQHIDFSNKKRAL
jgi:aryl-alcohol dehydrogenase-like predicted oxidoreductase